MGDIVKVIKKAAVEAVKAGNPSKLVFGQVESLDPLKISLNQYVTISGKFLSIGTVVKNLIDDEEIFIGDTMVLLNEEGGQSYFVLDAIAEQ